MAQNVIVPVIDLTAAAEGSTVPQNLQTALAFGSQTAFQASNSTDVIANTTGFWRIVGTAAGVCNATSGINASISVSDGLSTKVAWQLFVPFTSSNDPAVSDTFDLIIFLAAGESVSAIANSRSSMGGSSRQIADVNGNLINPSGFTPQ